MKLPKLLEITQKYLDDEKLKTSERKKCLKDIQQKLKKKKKQLKEKLAGEHDEEEISRLNKKLDIVTAQRKKVIAALKALD
ncbi:hypothetical protein [Neptuniibacter sp.]|uniref:hypothetical protein n=1 Tax=Neptuniibacter sp. TaxID=1962643 RepID=UPI002606EFF4|nr:hypothetical protein [Neptuniibacter sp.]MCP4595109.1 hypothetical protein [Neptuniibacter sp.]